MAKEMAVEQETCSVEERDLLRRACWEAQGKVRKLVCELRRALRNHQAAVSAQKERTAELFKFITGLQEERDSLRRALGTSQDRVGKLEAQTTI